MEMRLTFTALSVAADNRGSLSIHKRLALAVMLLQGASSRQIFGGLRMGAGCLPFAGVGDNREAPAGLMARETTPTRFRLSTKSRGNPAKAAMARLFLYFHKKGHFMPKHSHAQTEQTTQDQNELVDALDLLTASLSQADAVVSLLVEKGERNNTGLTLSHKPVIDALWAVRNLLFKAKIATETIEGVKHAGVKHEC